MHSEATGRAQCRCNQPSGPLLRAIWQQRITRRSARTHGGLHMVEITFRVNSEQCWPVNMPTALRATVLRRIVPRIDWLHIGHASASVTARRYETALSIAGS